MTERLSVQDIELLNRIADRCYNGWHPDLDQWTNGFGDREPMLPDEVEWSKTRFYAEFEDD